jgi:hypothetical protein
LSTSVHVEKYSGKGNDPWTRETGKPFRHLI